MAKRSYIRMLARAVLFASALASLLVVYAWRATESSKPQLTRPLSISGTPFLQRDIMVNGLRIRYVDVGDGRPLLLLHGHASRLEELDVLTARLRRSFRVIVPDLPGSGYSDKPVREYDLAFYEDTIIAFLDALGIPACAVGGGSLGGNLALRLARRAPERFVAAAVWAPAGAWEAQPRLAAFIRAVGGRVLFWPVVRVQSEYWYSDDHPDNDRNRDDAFAYFAEVMSPGFIDMYWGIAADQVGTSLFDIADGIRVPVLIVAAGRDATPGMAEGIARIAAASPDARVIVVQDAAHAISLERPEALASTVGHFLRQRDDR